MSETGRREILICSVQFDQELRSGAMSVLELAPITARLGARGMEYRDIYWKNKADEIPAVRRQLADLGLKGIYATFTPLYNRDPAKQAQLVQDLEDARSLGSTLMRVFLGESPDNGPDSDAMHAATQSLITRAGDYGIRLALENNVGRRLEEIKETLERLNSPVMGTNIDTSNYAITGQDIVAAIRILEPWVVYCHLKDAKSTPEGLKPTHIGNGILPIRDVIAALDATGRAFPICFEFPGEGDPETAITASIAFMSNL